jgi:hypothetical protein
VGGIVMTRGGIGAPFNDPRSREAIGDLHWSQIEAR